jgi:DNA-binding Xre family transcriptional regulator
MSNHITQDDAYHKRMALVYGSITSQVAERAKALGYITPRGTVATTRLSRASGISTGTLHYLFTRPDSFRSLNLITLAKLCKVLQAQPGELFAYVPGLSTSALGIDVSTFQNLSGTR